MASPSKKSRSSAPRPGKLPRLTRDRKQQPPRAAHSRQEPRTDIYEIRDELSSQPPATDVSNVKQSNSSLPAADQRTGSESTRTRKRNLATPQESRKRRRAASEPPLPADATDAGRIDPGLKETLLPEVFDDDTRSDDAEPDRASAGCTPTPSEPYEAEADGNPLYQADLDIIPPMIALIRAEDDWKSLLETYRDFNDELQHVQMPRTTAKTTRALQIQACQLEDQVKSLDVGDSLCERDIDTANEVIDAMLVQLEEWEPHNKKAPYELLLRVLPTLHSCLRRSMDLGNPRKTIEGDITCLSLSRDVTSAVLALYRTTSECDWPDSKVEGTRHTMALQFVAPLQRIIATLSRRLDQERRNLAWERTRSALRKASQQQDRILAARMEEQQEDMALRHELLKEQIRAWQQPLWR